MPKLYEITDAYTPEETIDSLPVEQPLPTDRPRVIINTAEFDKPKEPSLWDNVGMAGVENKDTALSNLKSKASSAASGIADAIKYASELDQKFTSSVLNFPKKAYENSDDLVKGIKNLFGLDEENPRYQLWPEKVVREALTSAGDIAKPNPYPEGSEQYYEYEGRRQGGMVPAAMAISALAGSGGLAGTGAKAGEVALGATPFLRPALKHKDKLYKGKPGQEHQDIIPKELYEDFRSKAMSGEDLAEYNFGFINDKGHFLDREKALKYGIDTGIIDPHAGKFGALTTTLMADSSKPGAAIEAMAKTGVPKNIDWNILNNIEKAIGPEASKALTRWVGGPPDAKDSGQIFGIFDREGATKLFNDPKIKSELYKAYQPLRDQLKKEHGDEITLYRYHGDIPDKANPHEVLSFTSDPQVAEWASSAPKERKIFSDADIKAKEAEFEKTGKVQVSPNIWLERKTEMFDPAAFGGHGQPREVTYTAIMRPDGMVTDTPSVKEYFKDLNKERAEINAERSKALSKVKTYTIPVDDIIAATDRFGQKEFIVRNTKNLFADSSKPATALQANKPAFFSAIEHTVKNIPQAKMTGDQWLGTLSNKPGVKPEELDWTGLKGFLEENKGKPVTKQQIEEHLASNKVELKEVRKGQVDENSPEFKNEVESILKLRPNMMRSVAEDMAHENILNKFDGETKYQSYQLPGGENYREMLLTLPDKLANDIDGSLTSIKMFGKPMNELTQPQRAEVVKFMNTESPKYKSSHWDEPNILAHVRMNDRNIDGKKSLHLEEIQSDWHQQGRDKGYGSKKDLPKFENLNNQLKQARQDLESIMYDIRKEKGLNSAEDSLRQVSDRELRARMVEERANAYNASDKYKDKLAEVKRLEQETHDANPVGKIPDAPFKKSWHELALKRMIREAAEKGYDRLSWTPGEAQAARYDLSKQLKELQYLKNEDGTYSIAGVTKDGGGFNHPEKVSASKLPDIVGKEMAEKIIKNEGKRARGHPANGGYFEGVDLKIGGEGMKGFYDQIIPKALEKLGKEHGVKVQKGGVETKSINKTVDDRYSVTGDARIFNTLKEAKEAASAPILYIDIPQSLKDVSLKKGFPLFSSTPGYMFVPFDGNPFEDLK